MSINELAEKLKGSGALLGLDLGTRTIGLAACDVTQSFATPLSTIRRRKFMQDTDELKKVIAHRDIQGLVLGLPFNMDGSEGPRAQSTRAFARNLLLQINLPLVFWDERLSTYQAEGDMRDAGLPQARRAAKIDAAAAAVILEGALARLRQLAQA